MFEYIVDISKYSTHSTINCIQLFFLGKAVMF